FHRARVAPGSFATRTLRCRLTFKSERKAVQKFSSFEEMLDHYGNNPVIDIYASQDPADYEIANCEDWPPTAQPLKPLPPSDSEIVVDPLIIPPYWRFHKNDPDP